MKELDLLLLRYLERRGQVDVARDDALFDQILELPDPQLARHLLSGDPHPDVELHALLRRIAATPA
jgi:succinate dehydrogenase flavin-adding protein (antitoxin of CptAB toxin-antitoxin module)